MEFYVDVSVKFSCTVEATVEELAVHVIVMGSKSIVGVIALFDCSMV
jgi:hypothetical protein